MTVQGPGILNRGELVLINANISSNKATKENGHALYNLGGNVTLAERSSMSGNSGPNGTSKTIYNGGTVYYVMPAPLGHL